jgi:hypothetical protein
VSSCTACTIGTRTSSWSAGWRTPGEAPAVARGVRRFPRPLSRPGRAGRRRPRHVELARHHGCRPACLPDRSSRRARPHGLSARQPCTATRCRRGGGGVGAGACAGRRPPWLGRCARPSGRRAEVRRAAATVRGGGRPLPRAATSGRHERRPIAGRVVHPARSASRPARRPRALLEFFPGVTGRMAAAGLPRVGGTYDEIDVLLFSNGVRSQGQAGPDVWRSLAQQARHRGRLLAVDERRFPPTSVRSAGTVQHCAGYPPRRGGWRWRLRRRWLT